MELDTPYFILFAFFCFFLVILNTVKQSNFKKSKFIRNLPPGPWKLPLIGNIHQIVGSLPHHALRNLANKYGPLMHLQLGEISTVVVTSSEIAKEIMQTHDIIFSNRPLPLSVKISNNQASFFFSSYGSYWRQVRKICTLELLTAKRVESFRSTREEEVSSLVKNIFANEGSVINLSKELCSLSNTIIARAAFGKKCRHQEAFLSCLERLLKLSGGFLVDELYPSIKVIPWITGMRAEVVKLVKDLSRILEIIIADHKENKGRNGEDEDLVDVLLKSQQRNDLNFPLTLDTIKGIMLDMFTAGTETSSATVEWALSEMIKNPNVMEKAQSEVRMVFNDKGYVDETKLHELKYLASVIKETLRLHPILGLIPRENSERCVINGYEIPAKTKILVNVWAIGRDPRYWTEAERFQPERFLDNPIDCSFKGTNFEYFPFGSGRRVCPGITFAIPNIELLLASLLYHFDWKLPNGMKPEELDMTESCAITVTRKSDLCLIPIDYHP